MGRNWVGGESVLLCWNSLTSASVTPPTLKSSPHQLVAKIVKATNSKVCATECRENCCWAPPNLFKWGCEEERTEEK